MKERLEHYSTSSIYSGFEVYLPLVLQTITDVIIAENIKSKKKRGLNYTNTLHPVLNRKLR